MASQPSARVSDIAQQIRATCSPFTTANTDRKAANDVLQEASKGLGNVRLAIMSNLAALAVQGQWTLTEVDMAAAQAAMRGNDQSDKSLGVFIGECKRAMHPKVAPHVPYIIGVCQDAWKLDKETDDRPCAKAFKREYHMIMQAFGRLADKDDLIKGVEDLTLWARERDPDLDPEAVFKRLQGLREQIRAFAADFPLEGFVSADEFIGSIGKDDLKAARKAVLAREAQRIERLPLAPVPTVVQERVAEALAAEAVEQGASEPEVQEGAFDVMAELDEALAA